MKRQSFCLLAIVIVLGLWSNFFFHSALVRQLHPTIESGRVAFDLGIRDNDNPLGRIKEGMRIGEIVSQPPTPWVFQYVLGRSGLCSQLMNLFAQAIYYEETESRTITADESTYEYRLNASVGVLTGFFSPGFPVFDSDAQQQAWLQTSMPNDFNYTEWKQSENGYWKESNKSMPILVTRIISARRLVAEKYDVESTEFYEKMVQKACPHLQFNEKARRRLTEYKLSHGVPEFDADLPSVAFHVRRGDKLRRESRKYSGFVYVKKLLAVAANVTFQSCFVASDSYIAFLEIRHALRRLNMTCGLYTLTQPSQDGFNWETVTNPDMVQFMSELEVMTKATYFVGTFNSNVGALTSVLRGCHGRSSIHYGNSYGVDTNRWFFR
jgi:hypothetical protein